MIRYWYNIVPKYWIIYVEKIINKTRSQEMISKDTWSGVIFVDEWEKGM